MPMVIPNQHPHLFVSLSLPSSIKKSYVATLQFTLFFAVQYLSFSKAIWSVVRPREILPCFVFDFHQGVKWIVFPCIWRRNWRENMLSLASIMSRCGRSAWLRASQRLMCVFSKVETSLRVTWELLIYGLSSHLSAWPTSGNPKSTLWQTVSREPSYKWSHGRFR